MGKIWTNCRRWVLILFGIDLSEEAQKICSWVGSIFILLSALISIALIPFALFVGSWKEALIAILVGIIISCSALTWFLGIKAHNWLIWVIVFQFVAVLCVLLLAYVLFFAAFK